MAQAISAYSNSICPTRRRRSRPSLSHRQRHDCPWLRYTETVDDQGHHVLKASIVLAASGMCEHGRILHHLKHGIENELNSVLLVGYQAVHTLGRRLQNKEPIVRIFGDEFEVRAEVETLGSFSAHADRNELFDYIQGTGAKYVFLVHGEQSQREAFAARLRKRLGIPVELPNNGDIVDLAQLPIPSK